MTFSEIFKFTGFLFFMVFIFCGCGKSNAGLNGIWYIAVRGIDSETDYEEAGGYNYLETLKISGEYYSWENIKIYDTGLFLESGERGKIKILKDEIRLFPKEIKDQSYNWRNIKKHESEHKTYKYLLGDDGIMLLAENYTQMFIKKINDESTIDIYR